MPVSYVSIPLYPDNFTFYLVRHGETVANLYPRIRGRLSDPAVFLAPSGHAQAQDAARVLADTLAQLPDGTRPETVLLVYSGYKRTEQTMTYVSGALDAAGFKVVVWEDTRLRERDAGFFHSLLPVKDWFKRLMKWMPDNTTYQGYGYFADFIGGESPADMESRMIQSAKDSVDVARALGTTTIVMVGHSMTNRVYLKGLNRYTTQWFNHEKSPGNCSICKVWGGQHAYIYPNPEGRDPLTRPSRDPAMPDSADFGLQGYLLSREEIARLMHVQQTTNPRVMGEFQDALDADPDAPARTLLERMGLNDT